MGTQQNRSKKYSRMHNYVPMYTLTNIRAYFTAYMPSAFPPSLSIYLPANIHTHEYLNIIRSLSNHGNEKF